MNIDIKKSNVISIRIDLEEKEILEKKAGELCMSLSQYVRYCALEKEEVSDKNKESRAIKFLNNNLPLMYRLMVKTTIKMEKMAERHLNIKDWEETEKTELKMIEDLGVTVEEERKHAPKIVKW